MYYLVFKIWPGGWVDLYRNHKNEKIKISMTDMGFFFLSLAPSVFLGGLDCFTAFEM